MAYPGKFLITGHVLDEVTIDFPEQKNRLNAAIAGGDFGVIEVDSETELRLYNELIKERRLGAGECSAIACAIHRGYSLAMEDSRACKQAVKLEPKIEILKTQDNIIRLIFDGILTAVEADLIKADWQKNYRFAFRFKSFEEII